MEQNNIDYKKLLIKYVSNIAQSEGLDIATAKRISVFNMGTMEFSGEEEEILNKEIYPIVKKFILGGDYKVNLF